MEDAHTATPSFPHEGQDGVVFFLFRRFKIFFSNGITAFFITFALMFD
ncbi:hypothetical protein [Prevotella denticola]|nr:hypothetical protein [Prevotella denticola]